MEVEPGQSNTYKDQGNQAYKKGNYLEAIDHYTKAIEINETESVFYSNRAICYKALRNFDLAYKDAQHAVELDDKNIKGHLVSGQSLAELAKSDPNTERLETAHARMLKALTLCAGQKKQEYEKDLNKNILRLKKLIWYKKQDALKLKKIDMLNQISRLMERDNSLNKEEKKVRFSEIVELIGDPNKVPERNVPDYLCCQISHELMEDPVTTQSGYTYERGNLKEYLKTHGLLDPYTKEAINEQYIFPNLNIKQAIESFLKECPWAFEFKKDEVYLNITF